MAFLFLIKVCLFPAVAGRGEVWGGVEEGYFGVLTWSYLGVGFLISSPIESSFFGNEFSWEALEKARFVRFIIKVFSYRVFFLSFTSMRA